MRLFLRALAVLGLLLLAGLGMAQEFFIHNGDRVVFYGDSITDSEWYPTLVQTYVLTRYPTWRNTFFNRGQSGDNTGSLARFSRDVVALKPNAFTFMMGYNDGGYQKLSNTRLRAFLDNLTKSVALAREADPRVRALLISSTPNETAVSSDSYIVSKAAYPYALLMFSRAEEELARGLNVGFIDMTARYGETMGLGRVIGGPSFALSRDGVHPQQEGQTFIAYHLLRGMAATPEMAGMQIDAAKAKVVKTTRCKVTGLKNAGGALSFTRVCEALPYPTPEVARPYSFLVRLDDTLNRDMLTVTGLPAPAYAIQIDGKPVAEVSAAALAAGVNLSRYPETPMMAQAMDVLAAVRKKDLLDCAFWRAYITTDKADGQGNPVATVDAAARKEILAAREALAAATAACYAINTPKAQTITLAPLEHAVDDLDQYTATDFNQAFLDVTLPPITLDWNAGTLKAEAYTVTLANRNTTAKSGNLTWTIPAGWEVTPAQAAFTLEAGKSLPLAFTLKRLPGGALTPLPTATLRWHWTPNWPYPMGRTLEPALQPTLAIARAQAPVTVDGDLTEWTAATRVTLDTLTFIDPSVEGKRLLWDGPADLSGTFYFQWDAEALYLAAVVRDTEHCQQSNEMMMWSEDMLQVAAYLAEQGKPAVRYEFGFAAYADHDAIAHYGGPKAEQQITMNTRLDAAQGTCTYEVAIPWAQLAPFIPAEGKSFRANVTVGDADRQPGKGYNYLTWTPGIAYGKNPMDYATLVLGK